jgi:hypothetical protein
MRRTDANDPSRHFASVNCRIAKALCIWVAVSHDANKWNPPKIQLCTQQRRQAFRRLLRLAAQSGGENNSCPFFGMEKEMLTLTIYSHP